MDDRRTGSPQGAREQNPAYRPTRPPPLGVIGFLVLHRNLGHIGATSDRAELELVRERSKANSIAWAQAVLCKIVTMGATK